MAHSNSNNPINWPEVFKASTFTAINDYHLRMAGYIEQGSPDSEALAQVRQAQYASAVSNAHRALGEVLRLQEQNMELAYVEAPSPELDRELDLLGL